MTFTTEARFITEKAATPVSPAAVTFIQGIYRGNNMSAYFAKLKDPRWQKKRLEILNRDQFTCRLCDDKESTLHVHHVWYERGADPWDYPENCLITLCENCHEELHVARIGDGILESVLIGGIKFSNIYEFLYAFQLSFADGPNPKRFTSKQWSDFSEGISHLINAVDRGATERQIHDALRKVVSE